MHSPPPPPSLRSICVGCGPAKCRKTQKKCDDLEEEIFVDDDGCRACRCVKKAPPAVVLLPKEEATTSEKEAAAAAGSVVLGRGGNGASGAASGAEDESGFSKFDVSQCGSTSASASPPTAGGRVRRAKVFAGPATCSILGFSTSAANPNRPAHPATRPGTWASAAVRMDWRRASCLSPPACPATCHAGRSILSIRPVPWVAATTRACVSCQAVRAGRAGPVVLQEML